MQIDVVIPCFQVRPHILTVIRGIGAEVSRIYVVDDCCPDQSGDLVAAECDDPRVTVIRLVRNHGVGGATIAGYRAALVQGAEVIVKIDGDGQMNPADIPRLVEPILARRADYVKGNRFHSIDLLAKMPKLRLFGNAVLSFVNKATSGYWNLMDPTNGFTAIHRICLDRIPLETVDQGYFFESDMLHHLYLAEAVVAQIPQQAHYAAEVSGLDERAVAMTFPAKYLRRFLRRIAYTYFLRDFSVASVQLTASGVLILFGSVFGALHWVRSFRSGIPATTGTVMLAALPVILGSQLLLAAVLHDVAAMPKQPLVGRSSSG
jgi:glycosyltransferase involved in cell wall biosynthesis